MEVDEVCAGEGESKREGGRKGGREGEDWMYWRRGGVEMEGREGVGLGHRVGV